MSKGDLKIGNLEVSFLFAGDIRYFLGEGSRIPPLFKQPWQSTVDASLQQDSRIASVQPYRAETIAQHRRERYTLPALGLSITSPLQIRLKQPFNEAIGVFNLRLQEFALSEAGTLGLIFIIQPSSDAWLSVDEIVSELSTARSIVHNHALTFLKEFADIVIKYCLPAAQRSSENFYGEKLQSFEIVDFDYKLEGLTRPPIRRLSSEPARQLAGFLRMTRRGVWERYPESFVNAFLDENIGHRIDEIILFHSRRLFRHHPESKTRSDVEFWFHDLQLGLYILLHLVSEFEYLQELMSRDLSEIRKLLTTTPSSAHRGAIEYLALVESVANRVADPLKLERHITHNSFQRALRRGVEELELPIIAETVRRRVADVRALTSAVAGQAMSAGTFEVAAATERLTKRIYHLTILIIIVTLIQIFREPLFSIISGILEWIKIKYGLQLS